MPEKNHLQKGSATIVALIVLLLTLGGTAVYFKNFSLEKLPVEQEQTQTKGAEKSAISSIAPDGSYKNITYGFALKIPKGWRIANSVSAVSEASRVVKAKNPEFASIRIKTAEKKDRTGFLSLIQKETYEWFPEKSSWIIVTNLSEEEEKEFSIDNDIKNTEKGITNFPQDRIIEIFASKDAPDFKMQPVQTPTYFRKFITLKNGVRAQFNSIKDDISTIKVPIHTKSLLPDGTLPKSVIFTNSKNAMSEKDFLDFVNTLEFSNDGEMSGNLGAVTSKSVIPPDNSLSQIKNKLFWKELLNGSYNESQIMISFVSGGIKTGKQLTSAELVSRFNGSAFSESESKRIIQAIDGYPKDFYVEVTVLLKDPTLSAEQRARISELLGKASSVEGVKILGQAWKETKNSAFHSAIEASFDGGSLAEVRPWTLPNHLNLSKELESLWLTIEDPSFSQAIAAWIARIGDTSGIELLLSEISKDGKTTDELFESGTTRAVAAVAAMKEVRNPQAIPILKKTFTSQPSTSATFFACGDALAYIGNADTIQTLINWVLQAPDDTADIAGEWFRVAGRADDGLIEKSLTSATVFRSQKVKTAVLETIS